MAIMQITDILVPARWQRYLAKETAKLSAIVQSGVIARDSAIDSFLGEGGGRTFDIPYFGDLPDDVSTPSTGTTGSPITPGTVGTFKEVAVALRRNKAWGSLDLAKILSGADPMAHMASRLAPYWSRQLQAIMVATQKGVNADNAANDSGDYTHDITDTYSEGVTDFSTEAFIDACSTMGDAHRSLGIVCVHSVVAAKMRKNDLIDSEKDSSGNDMIERYRGRLLIEDDEMPNTGGDYETWIFGPGAFRWGVGSLDVPLETDRQALDAGGGGSSSLVSRVNWALHPSGHAYAGTSPDGGPDNTANAHMLGAAASWNRVFTRKQVRFARLITTEHA